MNEHDRYQKTEDIISKFENGLDRFKLSPLFNTTIQMLVDDVDPLKVIDHLINVAEHSQNALLQQLMRNTSCYPHLNK